MNKEWKLPQLFSKNEPQPMAPVASEPKDFFSTLKGAIKYGTTAEAPVAVDIESNGKQSLIQGRELSLETSGSSETGGKLSNYAQKLRSAVNATAFINRSKNLVQNSQESMQTSINLAKNMPYIIGLCCAGGFFLFVSFWFLPFILIFPQKFSFCFALGCMCFMGAIALVRDPKVFLMSLVKKDKIMFSLGYVIALIGTFYFSLIGNSRILALVFALAQVLVFLFLL